MSSGSPPTSRGSHRSTLPWTTTSSMPALCRCRGESSSPRRRRPERPRPGDCSGESLRRGRLRRMAGRSVRVVSLIASATEMVCALGCEERLVGRSHECDVPDTVRRLPACSAPRLDADRPSRDIDRSVRSILQQALSVYRVDAHLIRSLRPDLVITQTLCEVCAVSLGDVEEALAEWTGSRPALLALNPMLLEDVWADVGRVADALSVAERGRALRTALERRVQAIASRASMMAVRPRAACVEWIDPLMAA